MMSRTGFLLVLLAAAFPLVADDDMTRLKVEVRSHGDKPIDRASVIVDFVEGRSVAKLGKKILKHWEIRTNQEGIAKLPSLPLGKIRVQVIAKGYQTFGQTYDISEPEKTITVKLNPPQPQYSAHE
jgi:hypothetical protein